MLAYQSPCKNSALIALWVLVQSYQKEILLGVKAKKPVNEEGEWERRFKIHQLQKKVKTVLGWDSLSSQHSTCPKPSF